MAVWFPACGNVNVFDDIGDIDLSDLVPEAQNEQEENEMPRLLGSPMHVRDRLHVAKEIAVVNMQSCTTTASCEMACCQTGSTGGSMTEADDIDLMELCHADPDVRKGVWKQLSKLDEALEDVAEALLQQLEQLYAADAEALRALGCMPSPRAAFVLTSKVALVALQRDHVSEVTAEIMIQNSQSSRALLLSASDARASPTGSTLLHLAAKAGNERFCGFLLNAGILPRIRDAEGRTAEQVARKAGQHRVASFLRSSQNMTTVRGGLGDAVEEALADERRVIAMEWHVMPLTGALKVLGGKHSMIVVTVSGESQVSGAACGKVEGEQSYVIEKAQLPFDSNDDERVQNGVFVSHYADAAPCLGKQRASLIGDELRTEIDGKPLTMKTVHQIAVSLGPHNPVSCTCHHQASLLYNSCKAESVSVKGMPNRFLRFSAKMASAVGINLAPVQRNMANPVVTMSAGRNLVVGLGSHREVDHGLFLNRPFEDHRHPFARYGAELSKFAYVASQVRLKNASGMQLVLGVDGGKETILDKSHSLELDSVSPFMKVSVHGRRGTVTHDFLAGQRYIVKEDLRLEILPNGLPQEIQVEEVVAAAGKNCVCFTIATTEDTVWVAFRGTQQALDAVVDVCLVPVDTQHDVQVQGGMWLCLNQRKFHVLDMIAAKVRALQGERKELQNLVLCGHSLGGGYAILAGLDLLARGLDVTSVLAFGAPMVVVPEKENKLWQKLNEVTTVYVNGWDCVPRLPSCTNWLFDVVPRSLPETLALQVGKMRLGINGGQKLLEQFAHNKGIFSDFDVVGSLVFLRGGSRKVVVLPGNDSQKRTLLSTEPPSVGSFVIASHDMGNYLATIRRLS